jgi:hypothetical protein
MTQSTKPSPANPPSSPDVTMQTLATGHDHPTKGGLPFDPAWLAIGVAAVVLVGASFSVMRGGDAPATQPRQEAPAAPAERATPAMPAPVSAAPAPAPAPAPQPAPAPAAAPAADLSDLRARLDAAETQARQAAERLAAMQNSLTRSEAEAQALAARIAPLAERLEAAEANTARLVLVETLRARLASGQPLGPVLARLPGEAPPALARFAEAAPPTEPALRLSFEESVRAARAQVAEGQPRGIGSLFTIRRGEDVIWGDANEAILERARRALTAGDLAGAAQHLNQLPDSHRTPMQDWIAQAEALVAARAALRDLAGG